MRRSRRPKLPKGTAPRRSSSSSGHSSSSGISNGSHKNSKPTIPNAVKKDLQEAKKREQELASKVASLETELKKGQAARDAAQAHIEAMSGQVKAVGERSKNRGAMLAKVVEAARTVEELKAKLKTAEEGVEELTQAAIELIQEEEREFEREERARKEAEKLAGTLATQRSISEQKPPSDEQTGKLLQNGGENFEVSEGHRDVGESEQGAENDKVADGGRPWKPLTFKFNL